MTTTTCRRCDAEMFYRNDKWLTVYVLADNVLCYGTGYPTEHDPILDPKETAMTDILTPDSTLNRQADLRKLLRMEVEAAVADKAMVERIMTTARYWAEEVATEVRAHMQPDVRAAIRDQARQSFEEAHKD